VVSTKLDNIDTAIINSLMQDGRKSFRKIALEVKASTPTVESRFNKMKQMGLIKKIQPILNIDKLENQYRVSSLVFIKSNPLKSIDIANRLCSNKEVKSVYMMTGEYNMVLKLTGDHPEYLEEFIRQKIAVLDGINSISYNIITKVIKEDNENFAPSIKEGALFKIICDYCNNEIQRGTARVLDAGQFQRYFCCNSCLVLYKDKYKARIKS
jgi:DNA-binding Lrp family transcriptional regulator